MRTNLDDEQDLTDAIDQLLDGSHNPFDPHNFMEAMTYAEINNDELKKVLDCTDPAITGLYFKQLSIDYWTDKANTVNS